MFRRIEDNAPYHSGKSHKGRHRRKRRSNLEPARTKRRDAASPEKTPREIGRQMAMRRVIAERVTDQLAEPVFLSHHVV